MRGMPFQPVAVPLSLQFTPVKAICNVAAMRAIFPGAVLVDAKYTPAMAAYDLSIATMLDQFRVSVPPLRPASIRTKQSGFLTRSLVKRCATVLTYCSYAAMVLGCSFATQSISLTVGFHCIHGQPHQLSNLFIAEPLLAVSRQHPFFISSHIVSSVPRVFLNDPSGQEC